MSMFKDEQERNKYLLKMSATILSGLLSAPDERFKHFVQQLSGSINENQITLINIQQAIFRDLMEKFKTA